MRKVLRIAAALLFTAAGALIGIQFSEQLKSRRGLCREIGTMLRRSAVLIRSAGADVYRLSRELRSCGFGELSFIEKLPERYSSGEDFHELWRKAANEQEVGGEERDIILRFGDILGTSDIEGQLSSIAVLESEIECLERQRTEEYRQKSRLYRAAGTLFGVMLGILII